MRGYLVSESLERLATPLDEYVYIMWLPNGGEGNEDDLASSNL